MDRAAAREAGRRKVRHQRQERDSKGGVRLLGAERTARHFANRPQNGLPSVASPKSSTRSFLDSWMPEAPRAKVSTTRWPIAACIAVARYTIFMMAWYSMSCSGHLQRASDLYTTRCWIGADNLQPQ